MKHQLLGALCLLLSFTGLAQTAGKASPARLSDRLTYKVQIDFQGFTLPFSKLDRYTQNKGITLGAYYNWNHSGSWQQGLSVGAFFNQFHGSTQHLSTTLQYNPLNTRHLLAGISLGAGYMRTGFTKGGWHQGPDGWFQKANRKGLLFVPAAIQAGVRAFRNEKLTITPVVSYQVNALFNYTPDSFIIPQSIISIGSRFNLR